MGAKWAHISSIGQRLIHTQDHHLFGRFLSSNKVLLNIENYMYVKSFRNFIIWWIWFLSSKCWTLVIVCDLYSTTYIIINRDNRKVHYTKLWWKMHSQLTVFLQHLYMCIYLTNAIGYMYHMVWLGRERERQLLVHLNKCQVYLIYCKYSIYHCPINY